MKNWSFLLISILFIVGRPSALAQNIVPNPDLELYTTCPTGIAQVGNLIGWNLIPNHTGSADMINACNTGQVNCPNNAFGNQNAHSGVGYFGFASYYQATPNFREYTYCTFTSPMVAGTTYDVSFWVSLSDNSQYGSDDALQIYFSNTVVSGTGGNWNPITTITPQITNTVVLTDKINWTQVSYQYTAVGGELYMTLGNYKTDANTTTYPAGAGTYSTVYFYVDDFIVEPTTTPCNAGWTTTTACSTDPLINLDALITGDTGGSWSGTGVSGNTFNPASGTQSITYTSPNGCDSIQTITVNTTAVATWTPPVNVCDGDAQIDLNTLVTGTAGGSWSGTGVTGNMFNPAVGTQTVTYSVGTAPCDDVSAQTITVTPQGDASWTPPTGLCVSAAPVDLNTLITGTAGGTWSGTGVTGNMFDPAAGTQTITYAVGTAPCDDVSAQVINVAANADASWTPPTGLCIGDAPIDLTAFVTGNPGGTWSGTGVTGNMFDPSVGSQSITYSVGSVPCDAVSTQTINVTSLSNPAWAPPANICTSDPLFDLTTLVTGDPGGTWSGTGVTGTNFDPAVGSQTLTYTVGSGGCQANSAQTFTVNTPPDPSWTPLTVCAGSAPVNLTSQITGLTGGSWSGTGMSGSVFDPFFGTQNVTYTVSAGGCTASLTQPVTVVNPVVTTSATNVSCFGLTDGSVTANVTGGTGSYTYSWDTSPPQTTSTATNVGAGNYIVTVTDVNAGCTATGTISVIEPAAIVTSMTGVDACDPNLGSASVAATGGVGGFTYAWSPVASTTASVSGLDSAMAYVTVTDNNGCTKQDSVFVNIWPVPTVTISPDTLIYYGDAASLLASGGSSYQWTPTSDLSCSDCPNPFAEPLITTEYCVTVIDGHGCQNNACTTVSVEIVCGDVFVPSAFSPNDDGENDALCVYSDCMESMVFTVYNRWGEKVFESSSKTICWDGTWNGKVLNSAVFVYILNGYLINGEQVDQKGNISLIR